jgi:hypothetical protein
MPRYRVRRTRVLRVFQTAEHEIVARGRKNAIAKVVEGDFDSDWRDDEMEVVSTTNEAVLIPEGST